MTVKQILFPVIKQEMKKYRDNGQRLRLKTAIRKRIICTVLFAMLFIAFNDIIYYTSLMVIVLFIYACIMLKMNNTNIIFKEAKKNPDMPVDKIIAKEIKTRFE